MFTTGSTLPADAAELLSWLDVHQHAVVDDPALDGLVLLDLPDHDSTQVAHRQEVDRLVRVVDVFVWVVDPQKYADAALHHDYLRRFAGHADVTVVVLNQIDTIPPEHRAAALDDLAAHRRRRRVARRPRRRGRQGDRQGRGRAGHGRLGPHG